MERVECSCTECKDMCRRPCWGTPEDARRLIEAGHARRLMIDYWQGFDSDILILCPAVKGHEGQWAPSCPTGGCTFQTADGMCEVHPIKPTEGAVAIHNQYHKNLHWEMAQSWDNDDGRAVIQLWREHLK